MAIVIAAQCGPEVAAELGPVLELLVGRAMATEGLRLSNDALAFLDDVQALAAGVRQRRSAERARHVDGDLHAQRSRTFAPATLGTVTREVTVSEAADLEGTSRQAIWQRCHRGSLPFRRDERGRLWLRRENLRPASGRG